MSLWTRCDLFESLVSTVFPPTCVLCGAPGDQGRDLCAGCAADLPRNLSACMRCALPFEICMPAQTLCGRCQKREPPFERCIAAFRYESAIPRLIVGAKFSRHFNVIRLLGQCLAETVREQGERLPEVLIPVPLHATRLRQRGYNQALEIARAVGRELRLPLDIRCCARIMATPPQTGLGEGARRRNIRGAFAVTAPLTASHLAILDDVVTTGTTVAELSRVLHRAGASRVDVWAVARTP
jgi:ComF family protein